MKPSSFQTTIENQFDSISVNVLWKTSERIICFIFQGLQSVRCPFRMLAIILLASLRQQITIQLTFRFFTLNGLSVGVENDLLSEALRELPDKKREILLLFYFMDMSDSEIADLLKLNRSTVYRHRTSGLALN